MPKKSVEQACQQEEVVALTGLREMRNKNETKSNLQLTPQKSELSRLKFY